MRLLLIRMACILFSTVQGMAEIPTERVGLALEVSGKIAQVLPTGRTLPVVRLRALVAGFDINVDPGAKLVWKSLRTGDVFVVIGPSTFRLDAVGKSTESSTRIHQLPTPTAASRKPLDLSSIAQLSGVLKFNGLSATGRRGQPLLSPESPAVRTARPEFRWQEEGAGCSYRFRLIADGSSSPLFEGEGTETQAHLPAGTSLEQGVVYRWTLAVRSQAGQPMVERHGYLRLLNREEEAVLAQSHLESRTNLINRIFHVWLLKNLGLEGEALREWKHLQVRVGRRERSFLPPLSDPIWVALVPEAEPGGHGH